MGVPNFLSGSYRYLILSACTDVQDIIDALNTELVTNGNWTDEGGSGTGPFKSPPNALDLSYMLITLTRVSATRLRWVCSDSGLYQINNQTSTCQDIDAGGTDVHITTADDLVCVDSARATPECFYIARLNVWPEIAGQVQSIFACSRGPRNDAGTLTFNNIDDNFVRTETSATYVITAFWVPFRPYSVDNYLISNAGDLVTVPMEFCNYVTGVLLGRIPHAVMCDSSTKSRGQTINVPLGDGTTGTFRIVGLGAHYYRFLAVRIG